MFSLITSASEAYQSLAQLTNPGKVYYAELHGYEFIALDLPVDCRIPRIKTLLSHLNYCRSDGDWVFFTGADLLLTNYDVSLGDLIDEDYDLVISLDRCGINNDSFLIRVSYEGLLFLEQVIERMQCEPNIEDQDGMTHYMQEIPAVTASLQGLPSIRTYWLPRHPSGLQTKVVSQRRFNSYLYAEYGVGDLVLNPETLRLESGNWQEGDFCLHLPGLPMSRRIELLKHYILHTMSLI